MTTTIKVLSVRQPWASLIVEGVKDVENRGWSTKYRGRLYIHAGSGYDKDGEVHDRVNATRGAIIGYVELMDCRRDVDSEWAEEGQWHWQLGNPVAIDPIPMRGKLALWNADIGV